MSTDESVSKPHVEVKHCARLWLLTAVILVGAALRISLLTDFRFHPDEALFAALGRSIISGQDPLLHHTTLLVDKPPLFYYLLAGGISINWGAEITARLPGLFASILSLALAARLAGRLWRSDRAAVGAAILLALSPFAIQFTPTVFADPIMLMWALGSLTAISEGHWGWAGVLAGGAAATKQSGLIFLPLVVLIGLVQLTRRRHTVRVILAWLGRGISGFGAVAFLVGVWVWVRAAPLSFWKAGLAANDPGRIIRAGEVWTRLMGWGNWLSFSTGYPWLTLAVAGGIAAATFWLVWRGQQSVSAASAVVLASFLVAYMGLLWLAAFPLLDRYLLPVIGLGSILTAGLFAEVITETRSRWIGGLGLLLALAMIVPALRAAQGAYPVGGDHGQLDGIDIAAETLRELPVGSVVYFASLGWPLTYYLADAPIYLASIDSGAALADDLATFAARDPETIRMIVLPDGEGKTEILRPAARAGFRFEPVLEVTNRQGERTLVVYRIRQPAGLTKRGASLD